MRTRDQKIRIGVVVSDKMSKTIVVSVERRSLNAGYKKYLKKSRKFKVHDEKNESKVGDVVQIIETRPISREKRWRLHQIIRKEEAVI